MAEEEEVLMEIEVAQAVYEDDYTDLDNCPPRLRVHIKPHTVDLSSQQVSSLSLSLYSHTHVCKYVCIFVIAVNHLFPIIWLKSLESIRAKSLICVIYCTRITEQQWLVLGFVHGRLPYENLKSDSVLRTLLLSLPIRKVIFTNADKIHAAKALSRLGLEDCFEGIICFETLNPTHKSTVSDDEDDIEFMGTTSSSNTTANGRNKIFDIIGHFSESSSTSGLPKTPIVCKPSEDAIEKALKIANIDPQRTLFFEDSVRNIQSGKRVGLDTVLVGSSHRCKGADYALESIHNIREAIPELWEADNKINEGGYSGKVVVETSVTA